MMRPFRSQLARLLVVASLGLLAALLAALPAQAAFPRLILVSGPKLEKAIIFDDLHDIANLTLPVGQAASVPREQVRGRPYFRLSLFWGDDLWEPYVREGRLDELRPEQANQEGRFYPAYKGHAAVIDLLVNGRAGPKRAPQKMLATLARHGVPTSLPAEPGDQGRWPWVLGGVLAGMASLLLLAGVVAFRRRLPPAPV
jgi:hypothetical protein